MCRGPPPAGRMPSMSDSTLSRRSATRAGALTKLPTGNGENFRKFQICLVSTSSPFHMRRMCLASVSRRGALQFGGFQSVALSGQESIAQGLPWVDSPNLRPRPRGLRRPFFRLLRCYEETPITCFLYSSLLYPQPRTRTTTRRSTTTRTRR